LNKDRDYTLFEISVISKQLQSEDAEWPCSAQQGSEGWNTISIIKFRV